MCVRLHLCMRTAASLLESVVGVDCALPPFQFQFVSLSNNKTISFSLSAVKQSSSAASTSRGRTKVLADQEFLQQASVAN